MLADIFFVPGDCHSTSTKFWNKSRCFHGNKEARNEGTPVAMAAKQTFQKVGKQLEGKRVIDKERLLKVSRSVS